jgi:PilZ domain
MLTSRRPADSAPRKQPVDLERRENRRIHTVMQVARVMRAHDVGLWRVRNISDSGMMLLTAVAVTPGERLAIALSDSVMLEGRAIWWDGQGCGVAFDRPVDCAALLGQLVAERKAPGYRPLRLPVDTRAVALCDKGMHSVRLFSLSQHGAGFSHDGCFRAGMAARLHFADGGEHRGVIRWSRDDKAGMVLLEPVPCAALESACRL